MRRPSAARSPIPASARLPRWCSRRSRARHGQTGKASISRAWLLALALVAPCAAAQPLAPDLAHAQALIRDGKAQAAWEALSAHERAHAGRLEYDYLLGIAALESGKPGRATFILERVLIADPGHSAARLEAGRAYFALGDYERAAQAFRAVLGAGPAPATRETIERYLERIEGRAPRASHGLEAYVEASLGRDSNVNAAATADGLLAPVASASREGDGYLGVSAGAAVSRELDRKYSVFGGADIRKRGHLELDEFDFLSADLRLGAQARLSERDLLRLTLEHEEYDRDRDSFRRTQGLSAQWSRRLERTTQVSAFAQALRIRYRQEAFASESADMLLAGAQAAGAFGRLRASASAYAGRDDATAGRADGDRALAGVGATLARHVGPRVEADAAFSYLRSDYSGSNREDRYVAIEVGLLWRLTPEWTLRPQLSRAHNRSSLPFAEYGRTEVSVSLRWLWRQ